MMPPITSKEINYALWTTGGFGNRLRAWRSFEAWCESGFNGRVALRELGKAGGGQCAYNLDSAQVWPYYLHWIYEDGIDPGNIMFNEAAPDWRVQLQGELWTGGDNEGYFLHTFARAQMRPALKLQQHVSTGLRTRMLLKGYCTPSSWADLEVLIERYPDHVIEISIYSGTLGNTPGRNALVWEVRKY